MSYKLWAQTPRPQDRKLFKTSIEQKTQTGGAFPGIKPEDIGSEDRGQGSYVSQFALGPQLQPRPSFGPNLWTSNRRPPHRRPKGNGTVNSIA